MRNILKCFLLIGVTIFLVSLFSCDKNSSSNGEKDSSSNGEKDLNPPFSQQSMPGKYVGNITVDSKGGLWLQTNEIDTTDQMPPWSSYIPMRSYLSRFFDKSFEVYDNKFMGAGDMIVDKYDRLWFISNNKVFYLDNNKFNEVYKGSDDQGYFEWITTDRQNNIWAAGYNVPLMKITLGSEIKLNILSDTQISLNSPAGCFDNDNNLWLIMYPQNIGRRDTSGNWTFYNPDNSSLPYQAFWCITADNESHIWVGTGYSNPAINLMKFNGANWESVTIRDDNGSIDTGTVRHLYNAGGRIWIVTELAENAAFAGNYLITFDGTSWKRINEIPSDDGISDIAFDLTARKVWIASWNKGLLKVNIE